jgi:hypothetical protein
MEKLVSAVPRSIPCILLLLLATTAPVQAFELKGLKSGMTIDEVRYVATSRGKTMDENAPVLGVKLGSFTLGAGSPDPMNAQFCFGRLFAASFTVPGGMRGFAAMAAELTRHYDQPSVDTMTSPPEFPQRISSISFDWTEPSSNETFHLSLNAYNETPLSANMLISDSWSICEGALRWFKAGQNPQ